MQKRIMFLGASFMQIPPLVYAKSHGHYVITCDYLPNNSGHKYADEYHNVSTTDMLAVLELAKKLRIDGIVAYASDPAAPTAAFVAERLKLPGNPFNSVAILTRKDLYRKFLSESRFNFPKNWSFFDVKDALQAMCEFEFPVVVKPVDSSGSKGVTVIESQEELFESFNTALEFSRAGGVIIEEYINKQGYQLAGDGFIVNGELVFRCFANEHFDNSCNGVVPIGESFPYVGSTKLQLAVHHEIQKLITLLGMKTGALNFDVRIGIDGKVYLMEIGPRNGGNLIPEVIRYATGVDLVKYTVDAALGIDCTDLKMTEPNGYFASYILHATRNGKIYSYEYDDEISNCILEEVRWCNEGDSAKAYVGSNCTLGTQILQFQSQDQMLRCMDRMHEYQRVIVS